MDALEARIWFICIRFVLILLKFQIIAVSLALLTVVIFAPAFAQTGALDYDIRGGDVTHIEIDDETTSLLIELDTRTRGELVITIPRNLIDAKANNEDTNFEIKVGGLGLNFFDEEKTDQDRTISIPFSRSDSEVTITGTHLFGQDKSQQGVENTIDQTIQRELEADIPSNQAKLLIFSDTTWTGAFQSSTAPFTEINGSNDDDFMFSCQNSLNREGVFGAKVQKLTQDGYLKIYVIQNNQVISQSSTEEPFGEMLINGNCSSNLQINNDGEGGGCLIATATYGSEMAPQVQQLREIRDHKLSTTQSGSAFLSSFNEFYYSFSPIIADYERQNPIFKELVKLAITPMITTLSLLNYVDVDSEEQVIGYGISLIFLNAMMYFGIPILAIMKLRR